MVKVSRVAVLAVFALAAAAVSAIVLVRGADAHWWWQSHYQHTSSNCTGKSDPINLVFYRNATPASVIHYIEQYLGWRNTGGSTMYIWDHNECIPGANTGPRFSQRKSADRDCVTVPYRVCKMEHIRLWAGKDADATWGWYVGGAAHFDDICRDLWLFPRHWGTRYRETRDMVKDAFVARGHALTSTIWKNWDWIDQPCGNRSQMSDGNQAWIGI
jgi:hypothetical protein